MRRRKPPVTPSLRFPVEPRDVPAEKAARRLHLTLAEFDAIKDRLYGRGFPRPDPDTGMYDLKAVEAWMDGRNRLLNGGLTATQPARHASEVFDERARRLLHG